MTALEPGLKKSELTRKNIIESAIALFTELGYEKTTMRLIAERAGVAVGNAYYYFASKEALMQGYYEYLEKQFEEKVVAVLAKEKSFTDRLERTLNVWVDNARPYHEFGGTFFRHAAEPTSPLSPFSKESSPTREAVIEIFNQVIEGAEGFKVPAEIRKQLPELLWMFHMGVVLYWVHDQSPKQVNTLKLIKRTAPLVARLIGLTRLPILKTSARELIELIEELKDMKKK